MAAALTRYWEDPEPVVDYCAEHTIKLHPLQKELREKTLAETELPVMLGVSEIFTLGANFIQLINGKKVLDVGTFTGASALAWALAAGDGAQIYTFDTNMENYKKFGVPIISKCKKTFRKIIPVEGAALDSLDKLIADGHSGTFDFAYIDADKANYPKYYEKCVTLLRKGGVIFVDDALWFRRILNVQPGDTNTIAIDGTNKKIFRDERTASALINCGDGLHIAFKK